MATGDALRTRQVSLPEACTILGLSRRTVERRLATHELNGVKVGSRWLVDVPADAQATPEPKPVDVAELTRQVVSLQAESHRLNAEVTRLTTLADQQMRTIGVLTATNAELVSRIPRLPAPAPETSAPVVEHTPAPAETAEPRRWRWFWQR